MKLKLLLLLATFLLLVAQAEEIVVRPGESIQDAIDGASPGDVIEVQSGRYYENLNVDKMLTLRGVDTGGGKPVVDAFGKGSAISINEDGIRLEGFVVTNSVKTSETEAKSDGEGADPNLEFVGILINGSESCTIANNTAVVNVYGIGLVNSSNNSVEKNTVRSNGVGIHLWRSHGNMISNNTASENVEAGIVLWGYSCNNTIMGNEAVKSGPIGDGIRVSGSNNTFVDNNASENGFYGIMLWGSPDNTVSNNKAQNNGYSGLWLLVSSKNNVTGNDFSRNDESGISLWDSSRDNAISDNYLAGNAKYGIYLKRSSNNMIATNDAINNGRGIGLYNSSNSNTVKANNASRILWGSFYETRATITR
jgi:parallel beta-helix repeat protein